MSTVTEYALTQETVVPDQPVRSGDPGFLADTWNVMVRELKPVFREPASVLFAMVQPLVFLGLFAPLLPDSEGGALQWFVPGIVAMTCLFGASSSIKLAWAILNTSATFATGNLVRFALPARS